MNQEFPTRKNHRLKEFDYSSPGYYFITFCTADRKNFLWSENRNGPISAKDVKLSAFGEVLKETIESIHDHYPAYYVDNYVIMPDHVHLILRIVRHENDDETKKTPAVSRVIQQVKGVVSKRTGCRLWQKLFYDHIIRDKEDYEIHMQYIDNNPAEREYDRIYFNKLRLEEATGR